MPERNGVDGERGKKIGGVFIDTERPT